MEILNQLSSRTGDKTEDSNKIVAEKCIANPRLLAEIAESILFFLLCSVFFEQFGLYVSRHLRVLCKFQ